MLIHYYLNSVHILAEEIVEDIQMQETAECFKSARGTDTPRETWHDILHILNQLTITAKKEKYLQSIHGIVCSKCNVYVCSMYMAEMVSMLVFFMLFKIRLFQNSVTIYSDVNVTLTSQSTKI